MPSNITPNAAGTLTPIKPDGPDVLNAASIGEPLQRLANKDAAQDLAIAANEGRVCVLLLDEDETANFGYMSFVIDSGSVSPPASGFTESGGISLFVPTIGIYEVSFFGRAKVVLATGSSAFRHVEISVIVHNTIDSSEVVAGQASLVVHADVDSVPEGIVGAGIAFVIDNPATKIIRLKAATGSPDWSIKPDAECRVSVRRVGAIV